MSVHECVWCVRVWLRVCWGRQRKTREVVTGRGVVLAEHHWTPPASGYAPVQQMEETILGATHLYLSQNTHSLHCTYPPHPASPNPSYSPAQTHSTFSTPPPLSSIPLHPPPLSWPQNNPLFQFSRFLFIFFFLPSFSTSCCTPPETENPIGRCTTQSECVTAATMQMEPLVVSCALLVVRGPQLSVSLSLSECVVACTSPWHTFCFG